MQLLEAVVFGFLIITNLIAFICFGLDKLFAVKKRFRISEAFLIMISLLGGSFGVILGMVLFHHKISKPKFRYTIPFIVLIQIGLLTSYLIQLAYGIQI